MTTQKKEAVRTYALQVKLPLEAAWLTDREIKRFVRDALETWGGQFHPSHPLFESLNVVSLTRKDP